MTSKYLRHITERHVPAPVKTVESIKGNEEQVESSTPQQASTTIADSCKSDQLVFPQLLQREEQAQAQEYKPEEDSGKEVVSKLQMVPSALRNYEMYLRIDKKRFLSDEDFNRVCVVVAGDQRRIFQRVLLGIYQRAFECKDAEEVKRARLLLSLHERGALFQSLEVVQ